jgi:hypothetical protein
MNNNHHFSASSMGGAMVNSTNSLDFALLYQGKWLVYFVQIERGKALFFIHFLFHLPRGSKAPTQQH